MRLEFGVEREERVEHHVAVVAGDVRGRPDRVEHAQIRLSDKTQGFCLRGLRSSTKADGSETRRPCGRRKFATRHPVSHPVPPLFGTPGHEPSKKCGAGRAPPLQVFSTFHMNNAGAMMT